MSALVDTSVIVPALVDQLPNHPVCLSLFAALTNGEERPVCSTHAIAETYSVLTALPLRRRVHPADAAQIIEQNLMTRFQIVELTADDYRGAFQRVASAGLRSGIVYDALHLAAAMKTGCSRIYTYNIEHFKALGVDAIEVTSP